MYYVIDKDALYALVDEEVSLVADAAYSEQGESLYDSVVLTEKDRPTVERLLDDAVNQFAGREFDICKLSQETYTDEFGEAQLSSRMRLQFHVPDFDTSMAVLEDGTITGGPLKTELDRYLVLFACAGIFQQRRAALVPEYTARAQSAMDKAVTLLKTRKHPVTQW